MLLGTMPSHSHLPPEEGRSELHFHLLTETKMYPKSHNGEGELLSTPLLGVKLADDSAADLRKEQLEEYKFLREELHSVNAEVNSIFTFTLALIGLIIGAAYSTKGDALILLPVASIVSLGAYNLLHSQTDRAWRIVGYMRRVLEPNLKGIRWETRMHAWREAPKNKRLKIEKGFHDRQIQILDWINVGLFFALLLYSPAWHLLPHDKNQTEPKTFQLRGPNLQAHGPDVDWATPISVALSFIPLGIFLLSKIKQIRDDPDSNPKYPKILALFSFGAFAHRKDPKALHLKAWDAEPAHGGRGLVQHVCEVEPPKDWQLNKVDEN